MRLLPAFKLWSHAASLSLARAHQTPTPTPTPHPSANYVPGCYAMRVRGVLPNQHVIQLEDHGITYRSLDE